MSNNTSCTCNCTASYSCGNSGATQVSWDNVTYKPEWVSQDWTVQAIKVTLTSAQILAAFSTPIEIIPAPGSGKIIDVVDAYAIYTYGSTTYVNNISNRLVLKSSTMTDELMGVAGTFVSSAVSRSVRLFPKESIDNTAVNDSIVATILNANPTTGDGTIQIIANYRTITL